MAVPVLDIHTVGAGGGSIARVDEGGALRVGPESAGADPGPACYGKGTEATVTDANLVLGRFGGAGLLAGDGRERGGIGRWGDAGVEGRWERMKALPVVERELRAAARRGSTYWMRLAAAGALLAGFLGGVMDQTGSASDIGRRLFTKPTMPR